MDPSRVCYNSNSSRLVRLLIERTEIASNDPFSAIEYHVESCAKLLGIQEG